MRPAAGPGEQQLAADAVGAQAVVAEPIGGAGGFSAKPQGIGRCSGVPGSSNGGLGGGQDLVCTAQHQDLPWAVAERRQAVSGAVDVHQHPFGRDCVGTHQIPVGEQPPPVQIGPFLRCAGQVPVDHRPVSGMDRLGQPHLPDGGRTAPGHRTAFGQQLESGLTGLGRSVEPLGFKPTAAQLGYSGLGQLFLAFLHQFLHDRSLLFAPVFLHCSMAGAAGQRVFTHIKRKSSAARRPNCFS